MMVKYLEQQITIINIESMMHQTLMMRVLSLEPRLSVAEGMIQRLMTLIVVMVIPMKRLLRLN